MCSCKLVCSVWTYYYCVTQPWNLLGSLSKITVRTTHPEHLEKGEEVSRDEARKIDRSKLHSKW